MPAHVTHEIFADEAFSAHLSGREIAALGEYRNFWVFGAQGPDFFLHNHRTRPAGLIFGRLLHNTGYGDFVFHITDYAIRNGQGLDSPLGAFILGFVTHAILDRRTHPFINFFSGWVERDVPDSVRFTNCHPFLERIIDALLLRMRAGLAIHDYDFLNRVDLGDPMPRLLVDSIVSAIESTYPEYHGQADVPSRVQNAYTDTMNYYRFTNPPVAENRIHAWERDRGGADPTRRLLALFHPVSIPELDYLNLKRTPWNNPGDPEDKRTDTFLELYELALEDAAEPLRKTAAALRGEVDCREAGSVVGNTNLGDGRGTKAKRNLDYISPLPLDEALQSVYDGIAASLGNSR